MTVSHPCDAFSRQAANIWRIRETIPEACLRAGVVFKYDLSLPVAKFYDPTTVMRERLKAAFPDVVSCGFGHLGDGACPPWPRAARPAHTGATHSSALGGGGLGVGPGNLHLNIVNKDFSHELYNAVEPYIYEFTGPSYLMQAERQAWAGC